MRVQSVERAIQLAISAGDFLPGERLVEADLTQRFGISRNTLREAYAALVSQGLLRRIPNRGVFLTSPDADRIRDIYRARLALEPAALRTGDLDLSVLDSIVRRAEAAEEKKDWREVGSLNQEFHRTIVASLGSDLLDETMEHILALMRLAFLTVTEFDGSFHEEFVSGNRRTVETMRTEGNEAAAEQMISYLEHAQRQTLALVTPAKLDAAHVTPRNA